MVASVILLVLGVPRQVAHSSMAKPLPFLLLVAVRPILKPLTERRSSYASPRLWRAAVVCSAPDTVPPGFSVPAIMQDGSQDGAPLLFICACVRPQAIVVHNLQLYTTDPTPTALALIAQRLEGTISLSLLDK
jgi:hypothetical protein